MMNTWSISAYVQAVKKIISISILNEIDSFVCEHDWKNKEKNGLDF